MADQRRTYVGAAVFFERMDDDGWTGDENGIPQRVESRGADPVEETAEKEYQ